MMLTSDEGTTVRGKVTPCVIDLDILIHPPDTILHSFIQWQFGEYALAEQILEKFFYDT